MKFLAIAVILLAIGSARCSFGTLSNDGDGHGILQLPVPLKAQNDPALSAREKDLLAVQDHFADWNLHLLQDAPHHSRRVKNMHGVEYDLHWYETEMGNITMGDVILDPDLIDYIERHDGKTAPEVHLMGAPSKNAGLWDCPIPYEDNIGDRRITEAIAHLERFTRWRFVPRTNQQHFLRFQQAAGCSSYIGRIRRGGGQAINLANGCETAATVHEIMHALGVYHEQSRSDRSQYVRINQQNIRPGTEHNFNANNDTELVGTYDYNSVMHYGLNDFSVNGQPTISVIGTINDVCTMVGQRLALTESDVLAAMRRFRGVSAGSSCGTNQNPPPWNGGCPVGGSMRLCGQGNTWNGVYEPTGTVNGRTSYIRSPWNRQERYMYYDSSRSRWCASTSPSSGCRVQGSGNVQTPDQANWSGNIQVFPCGSGAPTTTTTTATTTTTTAATTTTTTSAATTTTQPGQTTTTTTTQPGQTTTTTTQPATTTTTTQPATTTTTRPTGTQPPGQCGPVRENSQHQSGGSVLEFAIGVTSMDECCSICSQTQRCVSYSVGRTNFGSACLMYRTPNNGQVTAFGFQSADLGATATTNPPPTNPPVTDPPLVTGCDALTETPCQGTGICIDDESQPGGWRCLCIPGWQHPTNPQRCRSFGSRIVRASFSRAMPSQEAAGEFSSEMADEVIRILGIPQHRVEWVRFLSLDYPMEVEIGILGPEFVDDNDLPAEDIVRSLMTPDAVAESELFSDAIELRCEDCEDPNLAVLTLGSAGTGDGGNSNSPLGLYIGVGVGALVLVLLAVGGYFGYRHYKRNKLSYDHDTNAMDNMQDLHSVQVGGPQVFT